MKKKLPRVTLEPSVGSNGGRAVYLVVEQPNDYASGHRIAGEKCWGNITPWEVFVMDYDDLESLQAQIRKAKRVLRKAAKPCP